MAFGTLRARVLGLVAVTGRAAAMLASSTASAVGTAVDPEAIYFS